MWAKKSDLVLKYGQEFVDKLSDRTIYDETLKTYVIDKSESSRNSVIENALNEARDELYFILSRCYNTAYLKQLIDQGETFRVIKRFHIKLTIHILKEGGDCEDCKSCLEKFTDFCSKSTLCSDNDICLKKNSFVSVTCTTDTLPESYCSICSSKCGCSCD